MCDVPVAITAASGTDMDTVFIGWCRGKLMYSPDNKTLVNFLLQQFRQGVIKWSYDGILVVTCLEPVQS